MLRKYLFSGLMILLCAVLVSLVIRGRRQEKKLAAQRVTEVVKEYKTTGTRIIAPADLIVITGKTAAENASIFPASVSIRNAGQTGYKNPAIEVSLIGANNKILFSESMPVEASIAPGQEISVNPASLETIQEKLNAAQLDASRIKASFRFRVRSAELVKSSP
jgi:hypothetical protein